MTIAMSAVKVKGGASAPAPIDTRTLRSGNIVRRVSVAPLSDTKSCGCERASENETERGPFRWLYLIRICRKKSSGSVTGST
jgi:hypothetical protein